MMLVEAKVNTNGYCESEYSYPGSVVGVDAGRETSGAAEKDVVSKPVAFAPVAPNTGATQIYGS